MTRVYYTTVYREIAIEVGYTISPGFAGDRTDPPWPAEIDIRQSYWNGAAVELTDDERDELLTDHEDEGPDPDDARDRMTDDRMMGAA